MSRSSDTSAKGPSWITHGSIHVLAYLHENDAICSEVARETSLAESSSYRWLTELDEAGILEAKAEHRENGRPVVRYHLADDELGAAATVAVERLVATEFDDGIEGTLEDRGEPGLDADVEVEAGADTGLDD